MALSEQEEFELLSLERQRAGVKSEPSFMAKAGSTVLNAVSRGGSPMGAAVMLAGEGVKQGSQALSDAAYGAGGAVTDAASRVGASPETAAGLGFGANVAIEAIPAVVGGFGAGKVVAPAMEKGARNLMQSAIKPTLADLKSGDATKAIQTMLDEGISVTPGGMEKLREKIGVLNDQIFDAIKNSPATVDRNKAASALLIPLKRFEKQVTPGADTAAIQKAWTEFVQTWPAQMPVQLAQEVKQGTYRALGNKAYGELKGADVEAQKHLARGLKDEIAAAVPEVRALNGREAALLNALDVAERRVLMKYNNNPNGLALLAKNPGAWAGFMADRSPLFKSLVARMMNAGSEAIPQTIAGGGIAVGQAAMQSNSVK